MIKRIIIPLIIIPVAFTFSGCFGTSGDDDSDSTETDYQAQYEETFSAEFAEVAYDFDDHAQSLMAEDPNSMFHDPFTSVITQLATFKGMEQAYYTVAKAEELSGYASDFFPEEIQSLETAEITDGYQITYTDQHEDDYKIKMIFKDDYSKLSIRTNENLDFIFERKKMSDSEYACQYISFEGDNAGQLYIDGITGKVAMYTNLVEFPELLSQVSELPLDFAENGYINYEVTETDFNVDFEE